MAVMRPGPRTIFIRLKYASRIDTTKYPSFMVEYYLIEQLRNAASVEVDSKLFRINDRVTPEEADKLCAVKYYDVTINN